MENSHLTKEQDTTQKNPSEEELESIIEKCIEHGELWFTHKGFEFYIRWTDGEW